MLRKIITSDGSETFHDDEMDEGYHSMAGAAKEALRKFSGPCLIQDIAKHGHITLLDICFGLGYNTAAAIDTALESNPLCSITVLALENDRGIMQRTQEVVPPFKSYSMVRKAALHGEASDGLISIGVYRGDAREEIRKLPPGQADAVFLDPFSPGKAPQMWTTAFLRNIRAIMRPGARMATYSCAAVVRRNLREAGFIVTDTPPVGRRSPGTLAIRP